jgi:hypothetical protein
MDVVLRDLTGTECFTFVDNILIFANDIQEHARRLEHVLQRSDRGNLQLQPGKCVFAQPKVEYLGYGVSRDGISASPGNVQAVQKYPAPKNARDVRSFIGLASYCRLIPNFAEIAKPLTELLKKEIPFKWEGRQQATFEMLKEALCLDEVLPFPDFGTQFILTTDGS